MYCHVLSIYIPSASVLTKKRIYNMCSTLFVFLDKGQQNYGSLSARYNNIYIYTYDSRFSWCCCWNNHQCLGEVCWINMAFFFWGRLSKPWLLGRWRFWWLWSSYLWDSLQRSLSLGRVGVEHHHLRNGGIVSWPRGNWKRMRRMMMLMYWCCTDDVQMTRDTTMLHEATSFCTFALS